MKGPQWAILARTSGYHSFCFKRCPGIYYGLREAGPRFYVSSEGQRHFYSTVSRSLHWDPYKPQGGLTCRPHQHLCQQQPFLSSKDQAQTCLASDGFPILNCWWSGCAISKLPNVLFSHNPLTFLICSIMVAYLAA